MAQTNLQKLLQRLKKETGASYTELAAEIGVHRNTLNQWKLGRETPDWNSKQKIGFFCGEYYGIDHTVSWLERCLSGEISVDEYLKEPAEKHPVPPPVHHLARVAHKYDAQEASQIVEIFTRILLEKTGKKSPELATC